jgi:tetratricopeptide (TPR) repeat protein
MRFKLFLLLLSLCLLSSNVFCDSGNDYDSYFSLKFVPGFTIPIQNNDLFGMGGGGDIIAQYKLRSLPMLFFTLGAGYYVTSTDVDIPISLIPFSGGIGLNWDIGEKFNLGVFGRSGFFYAIMIDDNEDGEGNPFISTGAFFNFNPNSFISIGIEAAFKQYIGLYNEIRLSIGTSFNFRPVKRHDARILIDESGTGLELYNIEFETLFPVFYSYYDDHPIGNAVLINNENTEVKNIKITLFEEQYMTNPKIITVPESIESGGSLDVDLYGLFNNEILTVTEGTKVSVNITLEYTIRGMDYKRELIEAVSFYDRNAIIWDDDRKASSFVTAKDPSVLYFAKYVANLVEEQGSSQVNENLQKAMGMHEALTLYGMKYVIDPTTPYKDFSEDVQAVDFLQFPNQTLDFKAGDCDDLSVLYCSLLEAVGVETAFITVPGHIYSAISLGISQEEAVKSFSNPDDLIFIDNTAWIPVEVTSVGESFLTAWSTGASEWREHTSKDQANFYPMHSSWEVFKPVGFEGSEERVSVPGTNEFREKYAETLGEFINREMSVQEEQLKEYLASNPENNRYINRLGILYARYGFNDKAKVEFEKILRIENYVPALVNLGNIFFLEKDYNKALQNYEKAYAENPENTTVLLGIAKSYHAMENFSSVDEYYERLQVSDPELASKYAYLDVSLSDTGRAANYEEMKEAVEWEDE